MKAAFVSEFTSVRTLILQMLGIYLIIGVFVCIGMQSAMGMVAAICAMTPFLMTFSYSAYDSMNGWERFRAMLPVSRSAIVVSRYANILATSIVMMGASLAIAFVLAAVAPAVGLDPELTANLAEETANPPALVLCALAGMGITLAVSSVMLPAILRFGMTKAMRWVPTALFVAAMLAMLLLPDLVGTPQFLVDLGAWLDRPENLPLAIGGIVAGILAIYAASCGVAVVLYRSKDL